MKSSLGFLPLIIALLCSLVVRAEVTNVAGDGTAFADRPLYTDWPIARLIDGDTATVFHADTDDTPGLNYTVDLGRDRSVSELRIYPRQDLCCPERLTNFRVSVHADNMGSIGAEIWGQTLYGDGTNPGSAPGTVVKIPLPSPQTGRWIKVEALDNPPSDYALQMTELEVYADVPAAQVNRAVGKIATANQGLFGTFKAQQLVDGNRSAPIHGAEILTPGFAYTINLGSSVKMDHIVIWARQDGAVPERLSNYRVSVLKDNAGQPGDVVWKADLHTDGTNPGSDPGSKDTLNAALNAAGDFRGQWVRIESLDNPVPSYALQMTEVQVFGVSEGGVSFLINQQPQPAVAGIARTASFTAGGLVVNGDPTLLTFQWKKNGTVIPGATSNVYTTPPILIADDKSKFQCVLSYPGLADQSTDEVTLRVDLAFHADTTANRPLWPPGGWNISMLVDGDRSLAIHGDASIDPGYEYTVNLGTGVKLDEIDIYPRQDGCCADRLSNIEVSVHADNAGAVGAQNWVVDLFTDGTNAGSGPGAIVKILAAQDPDPTHKFEGQWLVIHSLEDPESAYPLQMSEIEAFGSYASGLPVLGVFVQPADTGTVPGRAAHLSMEAKVVNGDPAKITYQWLRNGTAIPGANTNVYVTPPLLPADDGTLYRCVLSYPGVADVPTRDAKVFFDGNYAKNQPASSNRPLWAPGNWNIQMIVDGDRTHAVHSDTGIAAGFAYEVDLGFDVAVDRIDIYPRQDGCCADRLANFRLSLHQDNNGAPGDETWHADLFTGVDENAGSGDGVVVSVLKDQGVGAFHGRWVQILDLDDPVKDYSLQMSELEVYGKANVLPPPTVAISRTNAGIIIQYANGVLQAVSNLGDAWAPVPGAASPFTVDPSQAKQFYRVSQ